MQQTRALTASVTGKGLAGKVLAGSVLAGSVLAGMLTASLVLAATAGASNTSVKVREFVHAKTTLATLHQTVAIPRGRLSGTLNPVTGALKAKLALPAATSTISLVGIGLAKATFTVAPTEPVTGKVDFSANTITTTSTFNIDVDSVTAAGTSVNLVGKHCRTSQPIVMTLTGAFELVGPSSFSSTYTIPPLEQCGLATVALNAVVAGPGNTFDATFSPFK